MSYTPFNAPLLAGLLGDRECAAFFSVDADMAAILRFETALARAQAECGLIPRQSADAIAERLADFEPDMKALGEATTRDGVMVPELVRQIRGALPDDIADHFHKGTTSQDVIDTSLMLRLNDLLPVLHKRLDDIMMALDRLALDHGDRQVMARTRMQSALPISFSHKVDYWCAPLRRLSDRIPDTLPIQLGGPEGALAAMGNDPVKIVRTLATDLNLSAPNHHWQTDRWPILTVAAWGSEVAIALGKIGADVAIMSQNEIAELYLQGGGSSSAMQHKNNPVLAESLVALARFAGAQMGGLHQSALHENERSGSSWSLEWMLFPQLMVATGASLCNGAQLLKQLQFEKSS